MRPPPPLPARIGPVEFAEFGPMVAVCCPQDFAHILQCAGGAWEPGCRRWLAERRRIGPVIRALQRVTDPLFRRAGLTFVAHDRSSSPLSMQFKGDRLGELARCARNVAVKLGIWRRG